MKEKTVSFFSKERKEIVGFFGLDISHTQKNVLIILLLVALLLSNIGLVYGVGFYGFRDVKAGDWFIDAITTLVAKNGIEGYPDGTFKPNNTITRAEFTKILVASLGYKKTPKTGSHWASGYISKAEEIKLIGKGELNNIDKPITRNEMAKMCANALDYLGENHLENRHLFKNKIKDFNKISKEYQDYVLKSYSKGIITGYPDGTFKGNQGLTRAEASTVIVRVFNERGVTSPTIPVDKDFIEPEFLVYLTTNEPHFFNYFMILVKNHESYKGKNYTFTTECISHPELNKRLVTNRFSEEKGKYYELDMIKKHSKKSDDFIYTAPEGMIYELEKIDYALNPKTNQPFQLKDGEKLRYRVTVTNEKTTKYYDLEVVFKNKKFL